ncbi:MAG: NAD(+) synthase [Candidatus Pacebacteria bacterium RIFCSPHIGHO2_01_FULL_46_10]|nr:MAG: NAD(+) synthase [Candidatus Pacebacteria bacterium RIFCSPHIGHO2_01_FULL_46_10]
MNDMTHAIAQKHIDRIILFIRNTFAQQKINHAVIGVSGGIDSALALTLLTRALGVEHIMPVLLPYAKQNMDDAKTVCVWNSFTPTQWKIINIKKSVDGVCRDLRIPSSNTVRRGNVMARVRMIVLFDLAKSLNALVCGTENKSEHYLGYFTRFGDAASDIEPIAHLYKTQVQQIAQYLGLPHQILAKHPSAGLWNGQTDEQEFGFTYEEADTILKEVVDRKKTVPCEHPVVLRMKNQEFKLKVPYTLQK